MVHIINVKDTEPPFYIIPCVNTFNDTLIAKRGDYDKKKIKLDGRRTYTKRITS